MAGGKGKQKKETKEGDGKGKLKAWLSMWALITRSCFYKILAVLAGLACLEGGMLYWALHRPEGDPLRFLLSDSGMQYFFIAALGGIFLILVWTQVRLDDKSQYTLMRLKVTHRQFFFVKAAFNILCFVALFAVQTGMAFWMVRVCIREGAYGGDARQTLFLAFYMDDFLHCLLPMAEAGKWVRNIILILVLGMGAAHTAKGKKYRIFNVCFVLTVFGFVSPMGYNSIDVICDVIYMIGFVTVVVKLWDKKHGGSRHLPE